MFKSRMVKAIIILILLLAATATALASPVDQSEISLDTNPGDPPMNALYLEVACESGEALGDPCALTVAEGKVWYWDHSEWVALEESDGNVTVPAGGPNPFVLAVHSK